jgi:hypothetical protein
MEPTVAHCVPAGGAAEGIAWEPAGRVQAVELVGVDVVELVDVDVVKVGCWATVWLL